MQTFQDTLFLLTATNRNEYKTVKNIVDNVIEDFSVNFKPSYTNKYFC
jgi:hypothetical protein